MFTKQTIKIINLKIKKKKLYFFALTNKPTRSLPIVPFGSGAKVWAAGRRLPEPGMLGGLFMVGRNSLVGLGACLVGWLFAYWVLGSLLCWFFDGTWLVLSWLRGHQRKESPRVGEWFLGGAEGFLTWTWRSIEVALNGCHMIMEGKRLRSFSKIPWSILKTLPCHGLIQEQ